MTTNLHEVIPNDVSNVIWQSDNGKWMRGFFEYDANFQRNVNSFEWVSEYFDDPMLALSVWCGIRPDDYMGFEFNEMNAELCYRFEHMATMHEWSTLKKFLSRVIFWK